MKKNNILLGLMVFALVLVAFGMFTNSASAYRGNSEIKGPNYSAEREASIEKAITSNDYTAWKNLMQNRGRVTQIINKDNFAKFAEAYKLAKSGDIAGAQKIRQELGLGNKNGTGMGQNNGKKGFSRNNCIN